MDTNRLKRFATEARNILIGGVVQRLAALGFQPDGTTTEKPELMGGGAVFMGEVQTEDFYHQWMSLQAQVQRRSFREVAEEAAYTWFNRLVAIRIMVKNELVPAVLEYESDEVRIPLIVTEARQGRLPQMDEAQRRKLDALLQNDAATDEQFALLIVAYCHSNPLIQKCFGTISDYTELLLPGNILKSDGFIDRLNADDYITDADYRSPELIGWLYQFYISERKDEVFAKKGKFQADEIPAATQIFTPNWIVKYMVQNTVLPMAEQVLGVSDELLSEKCKYRVKGANDGEKSAANLITNHSHLTLTSTLEALRVADLACGSGHILNECFDLLYQIYMEEGYNRRQAVENIFRHNLTGIDIDLRAKQLATFALLMKACQKEKGFADGHCMPRVLVMPDVSRYTWRDLNGHFCTALGLHTDEAISKELEAAFTLMEDADSLGSIMKFDISPRTREFLLEAVGEQAKQQKFADSFKPLMDGFEVILALTEQYAALVMNPPYMGSGNMNEVLSRYVKDNYEDSKADLFSVFMEVCINRLQQHGKYGMINMQSWMFLSSFEKLRKQVLDNYCIESMLHLGPRTFDELSGEVVQNTAFVIGNDASPGNDASIGNDASRIVNTQDESFSMMTRDASSPTASSPMYYQKGMEVEYTSGNLPHWDKTHILQFVTFHLADSMPQGQLNEWRNEKEAWLKRHTTPLSDTDAEEYRKLFGERIDKWLDANYGSCCLQQPEIKKVVNEALLHFDSERYKLHSYVVMPNHVHALLEITNPKYTLSDILHSWKSYTAHTICKILGTQGSVWHPESFDRMIRNQKHLENTLNYIKRNADAAHLGNDASRIVNTQDESFSMMTRDASSPSTTRDASSPTGTYFRLVDGKNCADKERMFLQALEEHTAKVYYPNVPQTNFEKIPGNPIAYWVSDKVREIFTSNLALSAVCSPTQGLATADNARFLRLWSEVSRSRIGFGFENAASAARSGLKWFAHNKGGSFRRWYGNQEYIINWENDGKELHDFKGAVIRNPSYYFKHSLSWPKVCSNAISFRYYPDGFIYDCAAMSMFFKSDEEYSYYLAYLNSKIVHSILSALSPTLNFEVGQISKIPACNIKNHYAEIDDKVKINISISKLDWDAHETSWDFRQNELIALIGQPDEDLTNIEAQLTDVSDTAQPNAVILHSQCSITAQPVQQHCIGDAAKDTSIGSSGNVRLSDLVDKYHCKWEALFMQLHANEEELNRQFIDIYGLQDELTPDVPFSEITILQQGEIEIKC